LIRSRSTAHGCLGRKRSFLSCRAFFLRITPSDVRRTGGSRKWLQDSPEAARQSFRRTWRQDDREPLSATYGDSTVKAGVERAGKPRNANLSKIPGEGSRRGRRRGSRYVIGVGDLPRREQPLEREAPSQRRNMKFLLPVRACRAMFRQSRTRGNAEDSLRKDVPPRRIR
jgi:hypothetical protein